MSNYVLSKKEKEGGVALFKELDGDLNEAAKKLFEDPNEKGSTVRGRALRRFWVEKGFEYRTKVKKKSRSRLTICCCSLLSSLSRAAITPVTTRNLRGSIMAAVPK